MCVNLKADEGGNLIPSSTAMQPFSFTYTPASQNIGKQVLIKCWIKRVAVDR